MQSDIKVHKCRGHRAGLTSISVLAANKRHIAAFTGHIYKGIDNPLQAPSGAETALYGHAVRQLQKERKCMPGKAKVKALGDVCS